MTRERWHMHQGDDAGPCGDPRCATPLPESHMGAVDWIAVVLFLGAILAAIGALR